MKKVVLFVFAITLVIGASAQKRVHPAKEYKFFSSHAVMDKKIPLNHISVQAISTNQSTKDGDVTLDTIGKAGNIYYAFENGYWNNQRSLNYDVSSNLLQQIHRADPETYPEANGNNSSIVSSQSIDGGLTWTYKMLVPFDGSHYTRYPQGFISNTEFSTDPASVIIGASGPSHDGATWNMNFFVSATNDEDLSGLTTNFFDNACNFDETYDMGTAATDDGYVYIAGKCRGEDSGGNLDTYEVKVKRGVKDGNHIDFETNAITSTIDVWNSAYNQIFGASMGMAWADDGSIGYVFGRGIANGLENTTGSNPIVWKSTDHGETWEMLETGMNMVDFPGLENDLLLSSDGHYIPVFLGNTTGVVDNNGNLQFFGRCYSGNTLVAPTESWDLVDGDTHGQLFNVTISPTEGIIGYVNIGPFYSEDVQNDSDYAYAASLGWTDRMHTAKSEDENAYFVVWGDTENADVLYDGENAHPDIFVWGNRPGANEIIPKIKETTDGRYWFHFVGNKAIHIGGDLFQIPVSTTVTQVEFLTNTDVDPVTISYVNGITFEVPVGVSEHSAVNDMIDISQNIPNPFSDFSTINVTLKKKAGLSIEVYNTLGQKVYHENKGQVDAGTYHFTLNAGNFDAGVYFYTVKANDTKVIKRMIVE